MVRTFFRDSGFLVLISFMAVFMHGPLYAGEEPDWVPILVAPERFPNAIPAVTQETRWEHPLQYQGKLDSPLVEVSPFVWEGRLHLLENWQKQWEHPEVEDGGLFQEDEVRIRDVKKDEIVSIPLVGHGLGDIFLWEGRAYVFASDWGTEKKWQVKEISVTSSEDLVHWTEPEVILKANDNESFFNVSVCHDGSRFVLLVESNDPEWPAFTFKYFESDDLKKWNPIPDAIYGREKYVGGPALYHLGGWFYTLYLEALGDRFYETRITRSKDLVHWQDAPTDRPFVTFNPENKVHPLRPEEIRERNASDAAFCEFDGKTLVYYTGGDQQYAGDLQLAHFDGTPLQLVESFFEEPDLDKPSPRQLRYQENQLGAFVHFGPATFLESDFISTPPADLFNPEELDAGQWVAAAKSFGAKHIVLTAKHHNGYCLWPTSTTDYSVESSPWKNGKGDVVREFVEAARSEGLEVGLYLSGGDNHFGVTSTPDPLGKRVIRGDRNKYFPIFLEQLRELLTNYGEVSVAWFDGAYDPFGWDVKDKNGKPLGPAFGDAIRAMVDDLQPEAVVFNGTRPDIRWSGSEQGWAPYPSWNVIELGQGVKDWVPPYVQGWIVPEANVHTRSTWFWTPDSDDTLKSVEEMVDLYHTSIGHGANLLVNMTPDTRGLIPEAEVERLAEFGEALKTRFANPIAETDSHHKWSEGNTLELNIPDGASFNSIVLEENIEQGERVRSYSLQHWKDGEWVEFASGESIGRKRINRFDPMHAEKIRLKVLETEALPKIRKFAVYQTTENE